MYFLLFGFCCAIINIILYEQINAVNIDKECRKLLINGLSDIIVANIEYDKINKTTSCCVYCSKIYVIPDNPGCYCYLEKIESISSWCLENITTIYGNSTNIYSPDYTLLYITTKEYVKKTLGKLGGGQYYIVYEFKENFMDIQCYYNWILDSILLTNSNLPGTSQSYIPEVDSTPISEVCSTPIPEVGSTPIPCATSHKTLWPIDMTSEELQYLIYGVIGCIIILLIGLIIIIGVIIYKCCYKKFKYLTVVLNIIT